MKSDLGDRNNDGRLLPPLHVGARVSMKSGLGDRNNPATPPGTYYCGGPGLNEVRSWRPEQSGKEPYQSEGHFLVSMKSGLRDRNNAKPSAEPWAGTPVSMKSGLRDRNNLRRLAALQENIITVSMKSGLRDRNNAAHSGREGEAASGVSMRLIHRV